MSRTPRREWDEAFVRPDDHATRVVAALIAEGVRFDVKPDVNGFWRIRADFDHHHGMNTTGLHWVVQSTRLAVAA